MSDGMTEAYREFGKLRMQAKYCRGYKPSKEKVNEHRYTTKPFVCIHAKNCPFDRLCDCQ